MYLFSKYMAEFFLDRPHRCFVVVIISQIRFPNVPKITQLERRPLILAVASGPTLYSVCLFCPFRKKHVLCREPEGVVDWGDNELIIKEIRLRAKKTSVFQTSVTPNTLCGLQHKKTIFKNQSETQDNSDYMSKVIDIIYSAYVQMFPRKQNL